MDLIKFTDYSKLKTTAELGKIGPLLGVGGGENYELFDPQISTNICTQ